MANQVIRIEGRSTNNIETLTITSYDPKRALRNSSHNISISVKSHIVQESEKLHNLTVQRSLGERERYATGK